MKRVLPLIVVGILVLSGLGAVALSDSETNKIEKTSFSFSQPIVKDEKEFISLDIPEANSFIMKQGKPMLPSYEHTFTFPFGTTIKNVICTPKNIQTQTVTKEVMPTPKAVTEGRTVSQNSEIVDYGTDPYPDSWYTYDVGCGRYNGDLSIIVDIEYCPVKYHPAVKTIEVAKEVDIVIEYETTEIQQTFLENYELLIIAPNEFSDEISSFVTYKNSRGVPTKFTGLNEIYGGAGRDDQEKIKMYIRDAIEDWDISNVLLIGAWNADEAGGTKYLKVPTRQTNVVSTDPDDDEKFVSDLYYADIYDGNMDFCDWDADGDNKFGEVLDSNNIDEVDLHPDVYIGRIPARNGGEVTTVLNKIKTYENGEAWKEDWFTDMVVVGGDTSPDYETVEGEYINNKVINMMSGFLAEKLWVTNGKLTQPFLGVTNIKNAINPGCGFIDFSGHGNTNVWATHPEESHEWVPTPTGFLLNTHIQSLSNGDKLPIVAVEACSTAKFNKDALTFNYAFLQNSGGGGIGTFGATALGWGYVGTGISQGLIGKMGLDTFRAYRYDEAITLGEMWGWALERYIGGDMEALDYKTTEEWTMFGDPSMQIAEESNPPSKPTTPNGPTSGTIGESYTYTTSTTDPDGDEVYYLFDWGDGTDSGWIGPFNSGAQASASKIWNAENSFEIKAIAKDNHGKLSVWSDPLTVTMPRSKAVSMPFVTFLKSHPNLFPILQQIVQRLGL